MHEWRRAGADRHHPDRQPHRLGRAFPARTRDQRRFNGHTWHDIGKAWSRSSLPVSNAGDFYAVTALKPSNAWAVEQTFTTGLVAHPLMLHWTGSRWLKATIPNDFPMSRLR